MLERLGVYEASGQPTAALNMALDEALLEQATQPIVRFYRWMRPALSFGYFGKLTDARDAGPEREIVRRWTGGGIVLHGDDLTYSFIVPASHFLAHRPARETYKQTHRAIRDALLRSGRAVSMATTAAERVSDACFANPVAADLLAGNSKIAGAAQRRTRLGLLQQGSIQMPDLPPGLAADFAQQLCPSPEPLSLTAKTIDRAAELAAHKYSTRAWLERR